jgi:hypothetical protein
VQETDGTPVQPLRRSQLCLKLILFPQQPGNGFLEALTQDHVTVFTEEMKRVTPTGFIDSEGVAHEVDVIICATG